jgi:hypothetical protein
MCVVCMNITVNSTIAKPRQSVAPRILTGVFHLLTDWIAEAQKNDVH